LDKITITVTAITVIVHSITVTEITVTVEITVGDNGDSALFQYKLR
jgi:hypothetical protein